MLLTIHEKSCSSVVLSGLIISIHSDSLVIRERQSVASLEPITKRILRSVTTYNIVLLFSVIFIFVTTRPPTRF